MTDETVNVTQAVVEAACRKFGAYLSVEGWGDATLGEIDDEALEAAMAAALSTIQQPDSDVVEALKEARDGLRAAAGHIEHMAAWIAAQKAGYSFEALGEDSWQWSGHVTDRIDAFLAQGNKCEVPPAGWRCTRAKGHEGPCAAVPEAALSKHSDSDALLGRAVQKRGGDYEFDGEVVAVVRKRSGALRIVVEDDRGLLLIMNAKQAGIDTHLGGAD